MALSATPPSSGGSISYVERGETGMKKDSGKDLENTVFFLHLAFY